MDDREGRLVAWDTKRNHIITNIKLHRSPVLSVAFQPAGKGAYLSAGGDGQLKINAFDSFVALSGPNTQFICSSTK
jgi:WD40 repeat protein